MDIAGYIDSCRDVLVVGSTIYTACTKKKMCSKYMGVWIGMKHENRNGSKIVRVKGKGVEVERVEAHFADSTVRIVVGVLGE